jgi:hypothetical protein
MERDVSAPGVLADLLKARHNIKGKMPGEMPNLPIPMEKLRKKVELWMREMPCDLLLARHKQFKEASDVAEREMRAENIMFA